MGAKKPMQIYKLWQHDEWYSTPNELPIGGLTFLNQELSGMEVKPPSLYLYSLVSKWEKGKTLWLFNINLSNNFIAFSAKGKCLKSKYNNKEK